MRGCPVADRRKPRRSFAAFLTGQADEEIPEAATPPPIRPSATDVPLIPDGAPRRPATRVVRPAAATPRSAPPVAVGPDGEEVPIIALPDYAAPPGVVVSAGYDENGVEYVFEDDPGAIPLVDPRYDAQDRNWVRYRTSWGGFLRIIGLVVLVLIVVVTIRNRAYDWIDDQVNAGGDLGEAVEFTVQPGSAVNDIATELADAGIINNATVFRYWLRCEGDITISGFLGCDTEVQFQAGDYDLFENMTFEQVVAELDKGPKEVIIQTVLIPEGLTVAQIVDRLVAENDLYDRDQLLEALGDADLTSHYLRESSAPFFPFEGLLFPARYDVPEQDLADERGIIARMSAEFDERFTRLLDESGGLPPMAEELGLDEYDIVIIASLIEEEAKLDEDRAKISRVIWNRLEQGWTLGIDASVCYPEGISCTELTDSELENEGNPWNTRALPGLPPTPIAAPGEASLEAALNPEEGPWMYYVLTDEDGSHTFAETDEEFEAAKLICVEKGLGCG
jgi:peptidoglycan lytic transglycosylase G